MAVTPVDIVNQALKIASNNSPPVTGQAPAFDNSSAGIAAASLYAPAVATIARQYEWDMARQQVVLTLSGRVAPVGWLYEYLYPTNGVEVWQILRPTVGDPNNPLPVNWTVSNALIGSPAAQKKVIQTDVQGALAVYNNNPGPDVWDPGFREAVVRLLASEFATSLFGRPDTAGFLLQTAGSFTEIGKTRDG